MTKDTETAVNRLIIRPFERSDRDALLKICIDSVSMKPFLPLFEFSRLAPILYLEPFLDLEPESCLVAFAGGDIVGYIAGLRDTRASHPEVRSYLRRQLVRLVTAYVAQALSEKVSRFASHKLTWRLLWTVLSGRFIEIDGVAKVVDLRRYPANCHLQVTPNGRSLRAGLTLMLRFRALMKQRGVPGQYSSVLESVDQQSYTAMLKAMGFKVVEQTDLAPSRDQPFAREKAWRSTIMVGDL